MNLFIVLMGTFCLMAAIKVIQKSYEMIEYLHSTNFVLACKIDCYNSKKYAHRLNTGLVLIMSFVLAVADSATL